VGKVEQRSRPEVTMTTAEPDWRFFLSEWEDYKRVTGVTGQPQLDELWSCMAPDLKRLAFDQGGKENLTSEELMLQRIKSLAVTELHSAVHTVNLHEAKQQADEPTKAFAARVRGIAASCDLSKLCPSGCNAKVSFMEETVYNVVLAGLRDGELRERCLSAAYMRTVTNISQLVQFCSAEESSRAPGSLTVGALRSTYQQSKADGRRQAQSTAKAKGPRGGAESCSGCGGAPHPGGFSGRQKECRAFNITCSTCGIKGHLAAVCRSKPAKPGQGRKGRVAAVAEDTAGEGTEGDLDYYEFASIFAAVERQPSAQTGPAAGQRKEPPAGKGGQGRRHGRQAAPGSRGQISGRTVGKQDPLILPTVGRREELPASGAGHRGRQAPNPGLTSGGASMLLAGTSGTVPCCHMEYVEQPGGAWAWRETPARPSPTLRVQLGVHLPSYSSPRLPPPRMAQGRQLAPAIEEAVADTGAQMNICPVEVVERLGIDPGTLLPVNVRVFGASRGAKIDILGAVLVRVSDPYHGRDSKSALAMVYVASNVTKTYLSLATLTALGTVPITFPMIEPLDHIRIAASTAAPAAALPPCTNSGVAAAGDRDKPCSCHTRALPPTTRAALPCAPTEANLARLKQFLMDSFASSTFNVCEHQTLPMLQSSPPLRLHVDPSAKPVAVHRPSAVPLHWQEPVLSGLKRDERLGVIERVPLNTPVEWQSRMHITAKHDGSPRRTVDYQALNAVSPRQTHHTQSPWHLVSSIPGGTKKSCFDAFHGYHSLPLATEEDRAATTFVTPWGRFRYRTCPQGHLAAGDAYTDRMDRITEDVERQRRCVDDTLLYDDSIEAAFHRAWDFLVLCGNNGVVLNPKKFQFAEDEAEFLGFAVTASGVRPTREFVGSILSFPTPSSLTDVRSWFGAVAQVSYTFATSSVMEPFRHLLSSKSTFSWSPDLEAAFQASKVEVARQCEAGVRAFDPTLPTALATDWCKTAMGYWLTQKHCKCQATRPGCCPTGWQTVYVGSRFCTGAESRYSPICGEAAAAAWAAEKCRFFLLGLPSFFLCLDHKPLIKIFSPTTELGDISNPRLYNQKVKLLPFRCVPIYVPGKEHVTADCFSRRSDFPSQPAAAAPPIDLLDIANVEAGYSSAFGRPPWVSQPGILAFLTAHPADLPSATEVVDTDATEATVAPQWLLEELLVSRGTEPETVEVAGMRQETVRAVTWPRLQEAVAASPICQELLRLLHAGLPENKADWPATLLPYHPYRSFLIATDGIVMCGERPLVPPDLRLEVMEHLHAAHQGVTRMLGRAAQSVFWPGIKADITAHREKCRACNLRAPSHPAPPPTAPVQPDFPFSHVVADFFVLEGNNYLAMADRYSGWLSIARLGKDDSAHIITYLRHFFSRWGVPKNLTTDGASVFTSLAMKNFYDRWGVEHRVSSAYYPRANKRAEVAVKSAKRLLMNNLGPAGTLDSDRVARALLAHRNNPDPETGVSPAQVIFGRELRDHLPAITGRYQPRQEWRLEADLRARAMAKRHGKMEERLQQGARGLPPLAVSDTVTVQDQQTKDGKPGRWNKSGTVVEVLPHDSYLVRVDGSRAVTQRNRRFLRKFSPFTPAIPVTYDEINPGRVVTRAMTTVAQAPPTRAVPTPVPRQPTPPPPAPARRAGPSASDFRQAPAGPPGVPIVDLLRQQERARQQEL
jgi:hypothetical protein